MKLASTISIAATLGLLASAPAIPQTSGPAVYIHAGALLDRPGQAPRPGVGCAGPSGTGAARRLDDHRA